LLDEKNRIYKTPEKTRLLFLFIARRRKSQFIFQPKQQETNIHPPASRYFRFNLPEDLQAIRNTFHKIARQELPCGLFVDTNYFNASN